MFNFGHIRDSAIYGDNEVDILLTQLFYSGNSESMAFCNAMGNVRDNYGP